VLNVVGKTAKKLSKFNPLIKKRSFSHNYCTFLLTFFRAKVTEKNVTFAISDVTSDDSVSMNHLANPFDE